LPDVQRNCIDRSAVMDLIGLGFIKDASNVVIVGPNGVGKSMCAANIAHQAVLAGHTVLFVNAAHMLGELSALDSDSALQRKLRSQAWVLPTPDRPSTAAARADGSRMLVRRVSPLMAAHVAATRGSR
jgi:hypothetical protein